jgi:hypothetical protein
MKKVAEVVKWFVNGLFSLTIVTILIGFVVIYTVPVIREKTTTYGVSEPGWYDRVIKGEKSSLVVTGEKEELITVWEHLKRLPPMK